MSQRGVEGSKLFKFTQMHYEENPFESEKVALEWINSVENEKGMFRDNDIYPRLKEWIKKHDPNFVVEIGSGQGICSSKLGNFFGNYIGIEPSNKLVERAKKLYESKNIKFIIGNAYQLPINNNVADAIFSINVWFHLESLEKAAKELSRILKIGGKFLIITANPNVYKSWKDSFIEYKEENKKIIGKVNIPVNPLSKVIIIKHSLNEIKKSLEEADLKIENIEYFSLLKKKNIFIAIEGVKL